MSKNIQEFCKSEVVTAAMTMPLPNSGEHFGSPVSIGYYDNDGAEVWVDFEGSRFNLPDEHIKPFIKQLLRAQRLAKEASLRNNS